MSKDTATTPAKLSFSEQVSSINDLLYDSLLIANTLVGNPIEDSTDVKEESETSCDKLHDRLVLAKYRSEKLLDQLRVTSAHIE